MDFNQIFRQAIEQAGKQTNEKLDVMQEQISALVDENKRLKAQISDLVDENKLLKARVLDLEEGKANSNSSPSKQQTIPQESTGLRTLVTPNTKNEVNVLKRGREDRSEEGKDAKVAKKSKDESTGRPLMSTTIRSSTASPGIKAASDKVRQNLLEEKLVKKKKLDGVYPTTKSYVSYPDVKRCYQILLNLDSNWVCYNCHIRHNMGHELDGTCAQYNQLKTQDPIACKECLIISCDGTRCPSFYAKMIPSVCASRGPVREIVKTNLDEALKQEGLEMPSLPIAIDIGQSVGVHIEAMHKFFDTLLENATYNKLFWDSVDKTGIFTSEFLSNSRADIWNCLDKTMNRGESSVRL